MATQGEARLVEPHETGPTCPYCDTLSEWEGVYCCECGTRLGIVPLSDVQSARDHSGGETGEGRNDAR